MASIIQVLVLMKQIFQLIGVFSVKDQSDIIRRLKIGIFLLPLVAILIEVFSSMIVNISNIVLVTEAVYLSIAYATAIAVYFSLLVNRVRIENLLNEIESIVNERKCQRNTKPFSFFGQSIKCFCHCRLPNERLQFLRRPRREDKTLHQIFDNLRNRFDVSALLSAQFYCHL